MNCKNCNCELTGRQVKYCSRKCKASRNYIFNNIKNENNILAYNRKLQLIEIKGGCCKNCGYNRCLRSLSFHHRDKSLKKFTISSHALLGKSWDKLLLELDKCDILCLNCHHELHSFEDNTYPDYNPENIKYSEFKCKKCKKLFNPIKNNSKYCSSCGIKSGIKIPIPPKLELEKYINSKTINELANLYNVSHTTIRTWLKQYSLVRPVGVEPTIPLKEEPG